MIRKDLLKTLQNELRREKEFGNKRKERLSKYDETLYNNTVESTKYVQAYREFTERFIPEVRVRHPETFAFYGSAEKYYDSAFKYIHTSYPYDGSGLEKLQWSLSASALDLAVLQHEYPKETGFVTFSPVTWGSVSATSGRYSLSDDPHYIKFSGGPYVNSAINASKQRESSLKIDGSTGNTLEFWMKKDGFVSSLTDTEVVFDSYTISSAEGASGYGRFLLELSSSSGSPFYLTYMSGTAGMDRVQMGSSVTDASVADGEWHHYAFAINHSGSELVADMYVDGVHNSTTKTAAASFGAVEGYFNGTIGALGTQKDGNGSIGYGKLSGSLDELRFWKTKRTAKDVGNYFDFPVNGATDSESINSILGIYYKFNEGTVSNTTQDKVILDYSGRLNNGEFIGYSADNRDSNSAITLSTASEEKELGDPIINPNNSRVTSALESLVKIGKEHDELNNSTIFKSVPQWAYEPGAGSNNLDSDFSILLQAMASRFDSIKILIDQIPKIARKKYDDFHFAQGSVTYHPSLYVLLGCEREFVQKFANFGNVEVFSYNNLLARNFDVKELPIINKLSLDEYFYNIKLAQTDEINNLGSFIDLSKAKQVSDKIMNSIYYDIDDIYKKKGTQSAFRNLIRCFGVDEKLVTPNVYINNGEVLLKDNPIYEDVTIKSLEALNTNNSTTLFQTSSTSEERHYIQGKDSGSMSFEIRTMFPDTSTYVTEDTETSIFGSNEVLTSHIAEASPNQASFVVTSVKDDRTFKGSRFKLSSSSGIFTELTSSYFPEVFDNTPWYLSVRFSEDTQVPLANLNIKSTKSYKVEFSGYQYELDTLVSSFNISASITQADYLNFIQADKSVFIGAQRSGITGSVQKQTENKFLSFAVWDDRLSDEETKEHAKSIDNIGRFMAFSETDDSDGSSRVKIDTLVLNWQFDDTTLSGSAVSVVDYASGSLGKVSDYGNIIGYKYPAVTTGVSTTSNIVDTEHLYHIKYMPIDNAIGESKIQIKEREIDLFEIDSRPVSYIYSYEKSAYQVMSRQMLRMIAGVSAFNNLIGEPIYKYRERYKSLDNIREKFFARVENDIDLERFIEYYKWVDSSLGKMLEQLQPATSEMKIGMEDVVESHAFERNKYKHQAPVFEFKDPDLSTNILGINELLYDWEHGHAPLLVEEPVYWAAFDGTDDFIDVPDHDDFSFGDTATDSPFSLTAWAVLTSPVTSQQAIVGKYNGNTDSEYLVFNNNGFLQFNIYDQNTSNRIQSKTNSSVFVDGNLYNITVTYDGSGNSSGINIYIDGTLVSQTRSSTGVYTAMHNTTVNFQIGSTVLGSLDFARNMRHVMVFDAELDSSDVTQLLGLYDRGKLNVTAATLTKYSNIVSWWKLDGTDLGSSTATDAIGGHDGTFSGDAEIVLETNIIFSGRNQAENCLWWKDRAERDGVLAVSGAANADRETLRVRTNTIVSGSTYVIRKLSRPYKFEAQRSDIISLGSNRKANKNKDLYKVINSGKEITLNKSDIYDFKQCNDVINPQEEKIYTAKVDVSGTGGYLDADADMLLPFTFYSSSAGTDFSNFKDNLSITNNHDDQMPSLQGPFVREHVGGMPHRRVKYLTPDADRAEAYAISASATTLTVKQPTGLKSIWSRGRENYLNIANIKTDRDTTPVVLGNYDKVYEIVQAHGRSINNRLLADSGSIPIEPISAGRVSGTVDYTVPTRQKSEHIFVSRFSAPGGPETMAHGSRDLESGEFSIYNTINYRNLSVRDPLNRLHGERSEQFGYRSGSTTQASVHMTNRNYLYSVTSGSYGEQKEPDNFYVQHPIPQNDMQYAWITASSDTTALEFVEANAGFGHQHSFTTGSKSAIQFISSSTYQNPIMESKLEASDAEDDDFFGSSVSIYGDTAVVGAYGEDTGGSLAGAAYVYQRTNGRWAQTQKLVASDAFAGDSFGISVSIYEKVIVLSAYLKNTFAGAAYVFEKSGGTWTQTQKLEPDVSGVFFGTDVKIYGGEDGRDGTIAISAVGYGSSRGAVYIFKKLQSGNWERQHIIYPDSLGANDQFGTSVSIYEDTLVAGAINDDDAASNAGAVYIIDKAETWPTSSYTQILTASDATASDQFGASVSIHKDTIIASSLKNSSNKGAVYVFEKQNGSWSETQKLQPSDLSSDDYFGDSLVVRDDVIVVGTTGLGDSTPDAGNIYIFEKYGSKWVQVNKIAPEDVQAGDGFGYSLSLYENALLVGSYQDSGSADDAGSAYVYRKMGKSWADVNVNYAGVNLSIVDGVDEDTNTLAKVTDATAGQLINHRQGPYGWSTWKQIRGYEHPIARAHKKSNTFSRVYMGQPRKLDNFNDKAVTFNGTDNYLQINSTRTFFTGDQFSVFAWIKHPEITLSTAHTILGINGINGATVDNRIFLAIKGSGSQSFTAPGTLAFYRIGDSWKRSSNIRIDDNEWHQVGFVYEKLSDTTATIELYVDGISQGDKITFTPFTHIDGSSDYVSIGAEFDNGPSASDFFNGQMADFAIWDKALTDTEVSNLVQYSGLSSKAKGPINLRQHSAAGNLKVWYRMGDGSRGVLTDGDNSKIYNNNALLYHATMVNTLTISDVSQELPGDYFVLTPQTIVSGSQDIAMNVGYSLGLDREESPYERARNLDTAGINGGPTYNNIRVLKNYQEPPVTVKYSPISITLHGDQSFTAPALNSLLGNWERGFDPRLPRFFMKRENVQKLQQLDREHSWNLDNKYYQNITNNIRLSEREELGNLGKYSISYGQVNLKKTFGNDIVTFANQQILKDATIKEQTRSEVVPFLDLLIDENDTQYNKLLEVSYVETLYPREVNAFSKDVRARLNFDFFGWKSSRTDRNILLSGNIEHKPDEALLSDATISAFPKTISTNTKDYKKSFFGLYDAVDVSTDTPGNINIVSNISASSWVLDSRKDLTVYPVNITSSYINQSSSFLAIRDQGTRGEGILQNDFSTFPLGYNGLNATPPFSFVYNRRIPQLSGSNVYLAGEAKWEAASGNLGPFYDSYEDYAYNDLRLIAKDHSIVPEFRISQFVEEVLNGERSYPDRKAIQNPLSYWSDFLSLEGAVYTDSEGNLEISGKSYKTYSNSDFLKYFEVIDDEVVNNEQPITPSRLTLKCKAAMKFLPYRGFYPAERVTQIYELFHKNYLSEDVLRKANVRTDAPEAEASIRRYLDLRANASRYQVSKPLFGPGILMNSIKAGVAVDYPIFTGSFSSVRDNLPTGSALTGSWPTGGDVLIPSNTTFTGSLINETVDLGIPRIKSTVNTRVQFEDLLNPSNIYNIDVFDNEPHPSASLQYGSQKWNRIIERPAKFGTFEETSLFNDLGVDFSNNKKDFANQIAPYTLAMQNFAAETVNFFVEDGHLTTAMSKPIDEYFQSGSTHKMRVRISNTNNIMYDRHSAFGPPVDDAGDGLELTSIAPGTQLESSASFSFTDPLTYSSALSSITDAADLPYLVMYDLNNQSAFTYPIAYIAFMRSSAGWSTVPTSYDSNPGGANATAYIFVDIDGPRTESTSQDRANAMAALLKQEMEASSIISSYYNMEVSDNVLTMKTKWYGTTSTVISDTDGLTVDIFSGSGGPEPNVLSGSGVSPYWDLAFSSGSAGNASFYTKSTIASTSSHGFAPYVPPFLDPNSDPYVEVTFTAGESKNYSAQEIIEASTFEYFNFKEAPNNAATNTNYINAMSLSASLNLGICAQLRTDNIETLTEGTAFVSDNEDPSGLRYRTDIKVDNNKKLDRWVIQTKWETPVMDFSNVSASALNLATGQEQMVSGSPWKTRYWDSYYTVGAAKQGVTSGSFMTGSTGMWHQKGELTRDQGTSGQRKGYYLIVEDVLKSEGLPLASKLGFINYKEENDTVKSLKKAKQYRTRIGTVEDRKMIKEAVVAIPYVLREDLPSNSPNKVQFVNLNNDLYKEAYRNIRLIEGELRNIPLSDLVASVGDYRDFLQNYNEKTRNLISDSPLNAIEYQLFMMNDYILPPALDFTITGNEPFMMYFFQFRASLNDTDISNIWQNLYPESAGSMAKARYSCADREYEGRVGKMSDVSYVSHYLDTISLMDENYSPVDNPYNLFSPRDTNNKTRWLVFKVKERGKSNLEEVRKLSIDPRAYNVEKLEYIKEGKSSKSSETLDTERVSNRIRTSNTLQYNWPYDYFSFVELIKLEAKIDSYTYKKTE